MIKSPIELDVTRRKLSNLERHCAELLSKAPADEASRATQLTLRTYQRLITRLRDEIHEYEAEDAPIGRRVNTDSRVGETRTCG